MYTNSYSIIEPIESRGIGINTTSNQGGYSRAGGAMNTNSINNTYNSNKLMNQGNNNLNNDIYNDTINDDEEESSQQQNIKLKKITAAFPIYGEPMSFINSFGEKDGLTFKAWKLVLQNLEKNGYKYDIKYVIINEPNFEDLVQGLKSRKYDVVIGDYGSNPSYLNTVSYSSPFMSVKDVGVYTDESNTQFEFRIFKKLGEILFYPFIGLVLLSMITSLYAILFQKKTNFSGAFIQMLNAILGDRGSLLSGTQFKVAPNKSIIIWILTFIVILISFIFLFYLQSVAISKSLHVISKNKDPFLFPEGKKILVAKGSTAVTQLKTCCDINVVETNTTKGDIKSIANEFISRHKKEGIKGFYHSGPEVSKWIKSNPEFAMSSTPFSVPSPVSFMISKYKPELLYEINKSISKINWDGLLNPMCKQYVDRLCFSTQI